MNDEVLVAVSGYLGDRGQIDSNLPVYRHHKCPIIVLSPADAPIETLSDNEGIEFQTAGEKGWIGAHTLKRQEEFLRILLKTPFKWFLFHDADSVCLAPELPEYLFRHPGILWSNEVPDTNPSPSRLPKIALQPPYFFHRSVLMAMVRHAAAPAVSFLSPSPKDWPMPTPTDCIDHWMLQVIHSTNMAHHNFFDGASFETTSDHGFSVMREHVGRLGKIFIHQVKHKHVLEQLMLDRRYYLESKSR